MALTLWVPELGGAVDIDNDGHYMALSNYGTMSRAERNRTRLRSPTRSGRMPRPAGGWAGGRRTVTGSLTPARTRTRQRRPLAHGCTSLRSDPETAPGHASASSPCTWPAPATGISPPPLPVSYVASPSANDPTRNRHRPGHAWAMSAVRAILANPRYLGHHVSGRTKKADLLLDPNLPTLGHVTRQQSQAKASWVTSKAQAYTAIVDEETWRRVQALAFLQPAHKPLSRRHVGWPTTGHAGRSLSRYPLAGLVICECCGKRLQGSIARGPRLLPLQGQYRLPATATRPPGQPGRARRPPPPPRRHLVGKNVRPREHRGNCTPSRGS